MRARWVTWIAGGVLVLAFLLLLTASAGSGRVSASLLGITNIAGEASYMVRVEHGSREPHVFRAKVENQTNVLVFSLPPHGSRTVMLRKLTGDHRIALACYPVNTKRWQQWRSSILALMGVNPPRNYKLYIQVSE